MSLKKHNEFIKSNLEKMTHKEIADALGYDIQTIRQYVFLNGLSSKRLPASKPGDKFGMLTLIKPARPLLMPSGQIKYRWYCLCDCGNEQLVIKRHAALRSGRTVSCGCWKRLPYHERFLKE